MRKLTPKQERFVQALFAGASQRQAYRAAYDCQRSSDKTVDNKASKLFARDEVRARLEELQGAAAERIQWDIESATAAICRTRSVAARVVIEAAAAGELPARDALRFLHDSACELNKLHRIGDAGTGQRTVVIIDDV